MESIFDDLCQAVRTPQKSARPLVAVAVIAVIGAAIGLGLVHDNAAADRPQPLKVRYESDPIGDMYPRDI